MSGRNQMYLYSAESLKGVISQLQDLALELESIKSRLEHHETDIWVRNEKSKRLGLKNLGSFVDAASKSMRLQIQDEPISPDHPSEVFPDSPCDTPEMRKHVVNWYENKNADNAGESS